MEEQITYHPHELCIHLQPNGALLLDKKSMFYFRLSGKAAQLALLLSKNGSLKKTARVWEIISSELLSEQQLSDELGNHPFTSLWKEGLLDKPLLVTGSKKAFIPISCTLQLTNACNLSCSFCYASSGKPNENELSAEQWIDVMQQLAAHGVADVTITGGEAKLVKGFKQIIAAASSLFTNVNLFSNGLKWSDEEIELVQQLGNVFVQVSIDGKAEIHDILRGRKNSFNESMANVNRLSQASVPVLIAMTVNNTNYEDLFDVIGQSVQAGAKAFRAGKTLSVGRASDHSFALKDEQEYRIKRQLKDAIQQWGDQMWIPDWDQDDNNGCTDFCTPGYLAWYIRSDGVVTPCQIEDVALGHILQDDMLTIGSEDRLWQAKCSAKHCNCISKVQLAEVDLPFVQTR
ncbi:sporulation killing factor system radical SAM maturase [Paenibacillus sp. 481]|uniref:sporulation killing factor system radical SAM maturase n=1 Tax=Paenibacillus sp. 481 TaxID=2835869 RepID=UPI001E491E8C|nr:sporulation killing factor system radical SAM maturase [Paenibacillus sp. 481]